MSGDRDRELIELAKRKYEVPEEIALQREWATRGFYLCERVMVDAHFAGVSDILVIGCGAGREAFAFAERGMQVTAVDLNEGLLQAAREISPLPGLRFCAQNAVQMGLRDASFSSASMLAQILSMIPGRANRRKALAEVYRVLKPGGLLILSSHNWMFGFKYRLYFRVMNPLRGLLRALGLPCLEPGDHMGTSVSEEKRSGERYLRHFYRMREMVEDLESAGFEMVDCRSRDELNREVSDPAVREKDYYLYYVARKPR